MNAICTRFQPGNRISGLCATIACALLLSACSESPEPPAPKKIDTKVDTSLTAADANMVIDIEGMTCQKGCGDGIAAKLAKLDAVEAVNVSFADGKAYIKADMSKCDGKTCLDTITGLGFKAKLAGDKASGCAGCAGGTKCAGSQTKPAEPAACAACKDGTKCAHCLAKAATARTKCDGKALADQCAKCQAAAAAAAAGAVKAPGPCAACAAEGKTEACATCVTEQKDKAQE
jgi:copper chaperone CopZ